MDEVTPVAVAAVSIDHESIALFGFVLVVLLFVFAKLVLSVGEFALLAVWANSKLYELFTKLRFFLVMRGELRSRRRLS